MTNMKTSPVTREILERETRTWPEPLRTTWIEAHDPITGDCQWVQQTRYTCARMVTRYLAILTPEEKAGRDCLLQRHQLKKFLIEAEKTASIRTLFTNVHSLNMAAGILYPERMAAGDLRWLQEAEARLRRLSEKAPRQRYNKLVAMEDLVYVAETALLEAPNLTPFEGFLRYRTGLFMLLGLAAPERLRALTSLRLEQLDLEEGTIRFDPAQIKMKSDRDWVLPKEILVHLEEWLEVWRPQRAYPEEAQVFIGKHGRGIDDGGLSRAMAKITKDKLGRPATPHLIRHTVATSMLSAAPERPAIVSLLLGHRSPKTRDAYTQKADSIRAGRFAQECFNTAVQAAEREIRQNTKSRTANLGHARL